jgi:phosphatidylethanolamine/phosphatidyl-N-methylethanolamine N-methyltransferase
VGLGARLAFLKAYVQDFRAVGAVTPTSAAVSSAVAEFVGASRRCAVAELGAGTGPITRALLEALPRDGRLWAFEISPEFVEHLRSTIDDPRLTVVPLSAAEAPRIAREAGLGGFDAVASAIPFSLLGRDMTRDLLGQTISAMVPGAPFVALQYHPTYLPPLMREQFGTIERRICLWNVPPAQLLRGHAPFSPPPR